jgi:hypothetical protein
VDGDGKPDTLDLSRDSGSGFSSDEVKLTLTRDGSQIEVFHTTSFGQWFAILEIPEALRAPERRAALELFEEGLFGGTCDRVDPSLAWLLASSKRLRWIDGPPRLPDWYTVRMSQRRLESLASGNTALETGPSFESNAEVWVQYLGGNHRRDVHLDWVKGPKSPVHKSPYELARSGNRLLLGTPHAVLLTDAKHSKHAWLYIHQEGIEKLRWPSVLGARFQADTIVIDIDPRLRESTDDDQRSERPYRALVNLKTGAVSGPE